MKSITRYILNKRAIMFFGLMVCFLVVPTVLYAAGDFGVTNVNESGLQLASTNIILIITRIIRIILGLLGIIVLALMLYAGFTWMTSQGDATKIEAAKKTLLNATIGLAIIFSSFAIVSFIITALTDANTTPPTPPTRNDDDIISFVGSGSLGDVILDHYPFRRETNVVRNTKITVTFKESFDPADIAIDTNENGILGDCISPEDLPEEEVFSWEVHCDRLNTNNVQITNAPISSEDTTVYERVEASVLIAYTGEERNETLSFVARPLVPLGNSSLPTWYRVVLTADISHADRDQSIFSNSRYPYYNWDFEVGTTFDFDPPVVESVYPASGITTAKNTIIQIHFDEAMDPVMTQGLINEGEFPFTNIIFGTETMVGEWRLTNRYKTVEFIPRTECGELNSCGEVMYCLETTDEDPTPYELLIRTAQLLAPTESWEAFPFTGVVDMAGNALDGNGDGNRDGRPIPIGTTAIGENEGQADNYYMQFAVEDRIDRRTPFVNEIYPGVDADSIRGSQPVRMLFNLPLFLGTMSSIGIEEYHPDIDDLVEDTLWIRPWGRLIDSLLTPGEKVSEVFIDHREFGPNGIDVFYFPYLGSGVKAANQNCFYPGYGPGEGSGVEPNTSCTLVRTAAGTIESSAGCVSNLNLLESTDTGCAYTGGGADASVAACLNTLRDDVIILLNT